MKKTVFVLVACVLIVSMAHADSLSCRLVGSWPTVARALVLDTARGLAFCGDNHGVDVVDVSDPAHPALRSESVQTADLVCGLGYDANRLCIANASTGLEIWDVSVPDSPAFEGRLATPAYAFDVSVGGGHAFVADGGAGMRVVSISDPRNPHEVGSYDTPGYAHEVALAGTLAYVADGDYGLCVVDVTNPQSPCEVGHYDTPGSACGVEVASDYVYVGDDAPGLRVIDVSNPTSPQLAGYYDTPLTVAGVTLAGGYVYAAVYSAGLQIIEFYGAGGIEESFKLQAAHTKSEQTVVRGILCLPPASGVEREASGVLLDISGRRVLDLLPGANDVSQLSPGVYFIKRPGTDDGRPMVETRKVILEV